VLAQMSEGRQTLLFSATLPAALAEFARAGLKDPAFVRLDADTKLSPDLRLCFATLRCARGAGPRARQQPAYMALRRERVHAARCMPPSRSVCAGDHVGALLGRRCCRRVLRRRAAPFGAGARADNLQCALYTPTLI